MAPQIKISQDERASGGVLAKLKSAFSIPTNTSIKSKKRVSFSTFYTAAVTFPFVITLLYWLKLHHYTSDADEAASVKALRLFVLISVNGVNSIIALVEIMVLSSVRKQKVRIRSPLYIKF